MNEINDKYRDLRVAHSNLIAKAKELRSRLQEVVAEKKAAYRANAYLMDRLEQAEPKQPIKRKTKD